MHRRILARMYTECLSLPLSSVSWSLALTPPRYVLTCGHKHRSPLVMTIPLKIDSASPLNLTVRVIIFVNRAPLREGEKDGLVQC